MPVITIPKALRDKLGDEATESFVLLLKEIEHESRKDALVIAEEKFERRLSEEVASLKVYISDVKADLEAKINKLEIKIADVKSDFEAKMANMKSDLEAKMANMKSDLEAKMANMQADLEAKMTNMQADLEAKMTNMKSDLEAKIANMKADLIKWMFIFWAGQIVVLTAILQIFFGK